MTPRDAMLYGAGWGSALAGSAILNGWWFAGLGVAGVALAGLTVALAQRPARL